MLKYHNHAIKLKYNKRNNLIYRAINYSFKSIIYPYVILFTYFFCIVYVKLLNKFYKTNETLKYSYCIYNIFYTIYISSHIIQTITNLKHQTSNKGRAL